MAGVGQRKEDVKEGSENMAGVGQVRAVTEESSISDSQDYLFFNIE